MIGRWFTRALLAFLFAFSFAPVIDAIDLPRKVSFSTLTTTDRSIEGLTGDNRGNLYTGGAADPAGFCPVWRVKLTSPSPVLVGKIPTPCSLLGIALNDTGDVFVADHVFGDLVVGEIWTFTPNEKNPPIPTTPIASGVPGANGIAFDKSGNILVSDGTTGQGRVWRITRPNANCATELRCKEIFRVQPMRNSTALGGDIAGDGVGRQARNFPPGTLANTLGGQDLVANGLAFNEDGDQLYIADTARGAIWKVEFDRHGNLKDDQTGCDPTFTENTLCLDTVFVAHPFLEGVDGIALDRDGNIWSSVNERNAIAVVTTSRTVIEVFRNPVNAVGLRNSADAPPQGVGNDHILEFPTSPFLSGKVLCTANSDGNRRDNFPNDAGEIKPAGPSRGKISCMLPELEVGGLRLPID